MIQVVDNVYELSNRFFSHSTFSTPAVAVVPTPNGPNPHGKAPLSLGAQLPTLNEANAQDVVKVRLNLALNEPGKVYYTVQVEGAWDKRKDSPQFDMGTWETFVCDIALPQLFAVCKYEQVALTRSRQLIHARFSLETESRFIGDIRQRIRDENA